MTSGDVFTPAKSASIARTSAHGWSGIGGWHLAPSREKSGRPRLAFFRLNRNDFPVFIQNHFSEHIRCLEFFFDVFLIEENCSYDEVCDKLEIDIALFESGDFVRNNRSIVDTHRHPSIPKIGLMNADAYCFTRSAFFSDMDEWGVENFFTISMSISSRMPHLRDRLFVWPNFADLRRFRTYPGEKKTPILFAGSLACNYPWRNRIKHLLSQRFPVAALPHGGWSDANRTRNMLSGEPYARALSSSLIVPTCGTMAHELVRKHLEVPACGALLLTERTAPVEAAGFIDMETCVFVDESDVVDKVEYLLAHPDEIRRISIAGQHLAHTRHDMALRNQIFQWFDLTKRSAPGEVVTQPDPFGDMVLRSNISDAAQSPELIIGRDWALIHAADKNSVDGVFDSARAGYDTVLNYHYEAEAAVGIARTSLRSGDAALAREWVWDSMVRCMRHGANEPDPVEWSIYILTFLCAGRTQSAHKIAGYYSNAGHIELARVRHLLHQLTGIPPASTPDRRRFSVHRDQAMSWQAWVEDVARMLRACGQIELAQRTMALAGDPDPSRNLASLRATDGPRRVGRQLWRLKYYHHYRPWSPRGIQSWLARCAQLYPRLAQPLYSWLVRPLYSWLAQLHQGRVSALANPFPEAFGGRGIRAVVLVGISLEDSIWELARNACRHSPEPCTLITVGDRCGPDTSPIRALDRGSDALGDGGPLQITLADRSAIIIGQAAMSLVPFDVCLSAELVVLTNVDEKAPLALAAKLDATPSWKRVSLPTSADAFGIVAWEADR